MIEGVIRLLFQVHKDIPGPWTFTRSHVNYFSNVGSVGSWEDHDWPDWTSMVGITQIVPAHILIE